jgi:hypothetical protein
MAPRSSLLVLLAAAASILSAENLVFNGGFELGEAGFACRRFLRDEANPALRFEALRVEDAETAGGKRCLRIVSPHAEQVEVFARELRLAPATEYTCAVRLRSSRDGLPVQARLLSYSGKRNAWAFDQKKTFVAKTAWARESFTFVTPTADKECEYFTLQLEAFREVDAAGGDLWIDEWQVSPGRGAAWEEASKLEASVSADRSLVLLDESGAGSAQARLDAVNHGEQAVDARFTVRMVDDEDGHEFFRRTLEIKLGPGEVRRLPFSIPLSRFGAFRLELNSTPPGATLPGHLAVAGRPNRKPNHADPAFCVAVNTGLGDLFPPQHGQILKPGFPACGLGADEYVQLLADMGCRLIREWDGDCGNSFDWRRLEPAEGKTDFRMSDRAVALAEKHGITLLPVLGGRIGRKDDGWLPGWLVPRCATRTNTPYNNLKSTSPLFPPEDAWRRHVREVASRYKGRLRHFEIINEPNADFFPAEYRVLLKAAWEELKAVDPANRVVGFCSSGDWGLPLADFLVNGAKLGGLAFADIVSYHPYESAQFTSKIPADEMNASCLKIIAEYAPDRRIPLWNTELYYLNGSSTRPYQSHDLAQRFLTDLGEGLGQSISISVDSLWKKPLAPHMKNPFAKQWVPSSRFVAQNALARQFDGARPIGKARWAYDSICYLFERDGRLMAGFWHYGGMRGVRAKWTAFSDARLFDLYGNAVPIPPDGLELGPAPWVLSVKTSDRSAFISALTAASVEGRNPVVPGAALRLLPQGAGFLAALPLENRGSQEVVAHVSVEAPGLSTPRPFQVRLAPKSKSVVRVPVNAPGETGPSGMAKIELAGASWSFEIECLPAMKVGRLPLRDQNIEKSVKSVKAVHSASFSFEREGEAIKLTVAVKDATPSGPAAGRQPWDQDCVEIFIDPDPAAMPWPSPKAYHDRIARLFFLPWAEEGQRLILWSKSPKSWALSRLVCTDEKTPDGYRFTLAIPLEILAPVGSSIGLDLVVDDAEGAKLAATALGWSSPGRAFQDRASFGIVEFP